MTCGNCGLDNRDGARFCRACGAPLNRACPACGTQAEADAKFCDACGSPLDQRTGESRKTVTIVFADLAGSTSLQEQMDPESARRYMDSLFALLRERVNRHEGRVVKYTGDGLMAVFGIPEVAEDDAVRAVRCAAEMQSAFAALAADIERDRGSRVALRVGVNTGEVVVPEATDDVVGDAVNVANRLQDAAEGGGVLVGEETWRLARDAVTLAPVPALKVRGRADAVRAYELVSLDAPASELAPTFVGRSAELETLARLLEESVSGREPRLVTVVGSAGLGKSRLAAEFAESLGDRAVVIHARCDPNIPSTFGPIADGLRASAGIGEAASDAQIFDALLALAPDDDDRVRIATVLSSLYGAGEGSGAEETFWAVRRLVEGMASSSPVLLVVDDAQWAEPTMLDLVRHLVEWSKTAGLLVVILARPEIRETRPLPGVEITLEGLDASSARRLTADLLGSRSLPTELVDRILETSECNPLFLRELVRMLVDDGVLQRDGDHLVVSIDINDVDVPPTIHALLAARIERLRSGERSVIERASVVGKEFYRGALLELVPAPVREEVDGHLETLRRKELVDSEGTYWIDEPVFRFHHGLIRDAAYRRLLKEARAELHERFADWLESKLGELTGEHEEVIGYHLGQAHDYRRQLGPLDDHGADLGRRAARRLGGAARLSLRRDDLAAAAALAGRALDHLPPDDDARTDVLLDRCEALLAIGDVVGATQAVRELAAIAMDARLVGWAECFLAELDMLTGAASPADADARSAAAARSLAVLGDAAGAAKGWSVQAKALRKTGHFGDSEAALDRALAAARGAGDRRRSNAVLAAAPLVSLWGPSPVSRATGRCLDVVRIVRITRGSRAVEATAVRCQAVLEALGGRIGDARRMIASARHMVEDLGLAHALLETEVFAGIIEMLGGRHADAARHLRRAHEEYTTRRVPADAAHAAALLARAVLSQGDADAAERLTNDAEQHGGDDLRTAITWRSVRAECAARRGAADEALRLATEAVAIADTTDALLDQAHARVSLSAVLRAAGRQQEASAHAEAAVQLFERKGASVQLPGRPVVASDAEPAPGSASPARALHDRYVAAYNTCDWDAMRRVLRDDFVVADHRPLSLFTHAGADGWVSMLTTMFASAPETGRVSRWIDATPDVGMAELVQTGQVGKDEGVVQSLLIVVATDGEHIARCEVFDPFEETAALARMNELATRA